MTRILVAEDETGINEMVCDYLEALGFETLAAFDGIEALKLFRKESPDLVLLDIMMPRLDGTEVLREIRKDSDVPVLMVTARSGEGDTVLGLELGADDYIAKPFSMKELAARIRTVLRRARPAEESGGADEGAGEVISLGELRIDSSRRSVHIGGQAVDLTAAQFGILLKMLRSPGRVFNRMELLNAFQEDPYEGYEG
jgi:DNA-binding response OmpR family regulator